MRCLENNVECRFSFSAKMGKPKGSKNKKTLAKMVAEVDQPHAHPQNDRRRRRRTPKVEPDVAIPSIEGEFHPCPEICHSVEHRDSMQLDESIYLEPGHVGTHVRDFQSPSTLGFPGDYSFWEVSSS